MYIDFDEYRHYSSRNYEFLKQNVDENIHCVHGYAYSSAKQKICTWVNDNSWGMIKNWFPQENPIKKQKQFFLCKECTYVQKYINGNDEKIDATEDIEPTFLS